MKSRVYYILQPIWHYVKCVLIMRTEVGRNIRKRFASFGIGAVIYRPLLQISGIDKVSIGSNTTILNGARLAVYGDKKFINPTIEIGDNCYFGFGISILAHSSSTIRIGNDVLFASNVLITNENHGIDPEEKVPYMHQDLSAKPIEIGDGCWIGEKVCILPGVSIGKKSIIGAGSVVTKSIPAYSIAVGNPAKIIKKYNFDHKKWESEN